MVKSCVSRSALCVVVLMIAASCAHAALTTGEATALGQIIAAFPGLSDPPQDPGLYDVFNGSLPGGPGMFLTSLCDSGDGYAMIGVYCEAGHIAGLYFVDAWGPIDSSKSLNHLNGLTSLKSFTVNSLLPKMVDSCDQFMAALFPAVSLRSLRVGANYPNTATLNSLIPTLSGLESLKLEHEIDQVPDFTNLVALRELSLNMGSQVTSLDAFLPCATSLRSLDLNGATSLTNVSALADLTALETVSMVVDGAHATFSNITLPVNLISLKVIAPPSHALDIIATGSQVTEVSILNSFSMNIASVPSTVKKLELMPLGDSPYGFNFIFPEALEVFSMAGLIGNGGTYLIHPSLGNCAHLSELTITRADGNMDSHIAALPSLRNTNMTRLHIGDFTTNSSGLICDVLDSTKLVLLEIEEDIAVPSCGMSSPYPALKYFKHYGIDTTPAVFSSLLALLPPTLTQLSVYSGQGSSDTGVFSWDDFAAKFSSLEILSISSSPWLKTFPAAPLMRITSLKQLYMPESGMTGSIPEDFFVALPNLKHLEVSSNRLNGTFPWYGLQNIETISASANNFESWPSVAGGAPNLKYVFFTDGHFRQIPDDISFSEMPSLTFLSIAGHSSLDGPVPAFWAHHPTISYVALNNNNFSGPLPPMMISPRLTSLSLGGNKLCGNLFSVPSARGLQSLQVADNRLSGTYPSTWSSKLTINSVLDLSTNLFNGTLPHQLTSWISQLQSISLNRNDFRGPVPDLSNLTSLSALLLSSTSLDMCAASPNINSTLLTNCEFFDTAVDACNCPSFWTVSACPLECSVIPPPVAVLNPSEADLECIIPPARPPAANAPTPPTAPITSEPSGGGQVPTSAAQSPFVLQLSALAISIMIAVSLL